MTRSMNEIGILLLVLLAGFGLGVLFFGGLWLTVQKGLSSANPALLFLGSLIARSTIVLLGFYYVGSNDWKRFVICLAGFLIARTVIKRQTTRKKPAVTGVKKDMNNET